MWRRAGRAGFAALSVASVSIVAVVQMNPVEVGSNISTYLRAFGYRTQPDWLLSPKADDWAVLIATVVFILSSFAFVATFFRNSPTRAIPPQQRKTGGQTQE